ncbi:GNAT family N-acetyltransferase [Modestobacter sp. SYSU DS0290]
MIIRREQPADAGRVREVHRAAFAPPDLPDGGEAVEVRLVDELRADPGFLPHLALVAVQGDQVIGHVLATRGRLEPLGVPALGLGPLGVLPTAQRRGVGTALVHALLAVAEACDERLVVLLGAPAYYRRFGFRPAAELGVTAPDPHWGEHFQARLLGPATPPGTFRYAAPFDRL